MESSFPTISLTNVNVEEIHRIIQQDCRLSIKAIAVMVNIDRKSVRRILVEHLKMKSVYQNGP